MNVSALFASVLLAYGGMLGFCLGKERHWKQLVNPHLPTWLRHLCGPFGGFLLGLAMYASWQAWPGGMAVVGWFGLISLAGFALLMLIPYAPRVATSLPMLGASIWVVLALL